MARPHRCARCDTVNIKKFHSRQLCDECRYLFLVFRFGLDHDLARIEEAQQKTRPWNFCAEANCWRVLRNRMGKGEHCDIFLYELYNVMGTPLPDPSSKRGNETGNLVNSKKTMSQDDYHQLSLLRIRAKRRLSKIKP